MPSDRKTREEISDLQGVHNLIQTYEEIAAIRMQRVKNSVLNNRDFLSDLLDIYKQVRFSYDKHNPTGELARNGRVVHVLLSANTGLYGDIVRRTFDLFLKGLQSTSLDANTDIVVVGKAGQKLFEGVRSGLGVDSYKYFELPDSTSDPSDFVEIVSYISEYQKVIVYHGQFESILTQKPIKQELSGDVPEPEVPVTGVSEYMFEPDVEKVAGFFESEILASIFEQTLYESSLGKFAARMINLDRAVVNIERILETEKQRAQKVRHSIANKRQQGTLSSMVLWNK